MRTFWDRGYDGTSLSDLTEATGVGRQSLYLEFGDKQWRYLAARRSLFGHGRVETWTFTASPSPSLWRFLMSPFSGNAHVPSW